ncbi:MAG: ribonuclease PH [Anaerolineae bacterium]|jgi:ribonuclease PH|nr:ribonuclease PH [Anaerolineae bacterium]
MPRKDGRRSDEVRPVRITTVFTKYAEGSALICLGDTHVLCNVSVENAVPAHRLGKGGWVTAEYSLLPRSTLTRTPRETAGLTARTQEIRRLIGRSLRASVDLSLLGERTFIADCDVLQADGGTRTAAVTGAYVALALAVRRLVAEGEVDPRALLAPVAAVSVGMVGGEPLLDLCYEEDLAADVDFNVVMNARGQYVEVQGTAEGRPFSHGDLLRLLEMAHRGIGLLLAAQEKALA